MGAVWLHDLADIARFVGLDVVEMPGWHERARGSGGLDELRGVIWHHTASPPSWDGARDANYIAHAPLAPISQAYLDRHGRCWIVAAGAANHAGKGGPLPWLPKDRANSLMAGVEMGNNGIGEVWPSVQVEASMLLAAGIHNGRGIPGGIERHIAHKEWCGPGTSTPGRKIDPFGEWAYAGNWGDKQGRIDWWRYLVDIRFHLGR